MKINALTISLPDGLKNLFYFDSYSVSHKFNCAALCFVFINQREAFEIWTKLHTKKPPDGDGGFCIRLKFEIACDVLSEFSCFC